jgi:acetate CoA/acetoacetate CoA-transferase alpha subunit
MRAAVAPAVAAELVPDGATVMIGGFMGVGSPHRIIAALVARGARRLTVIANDTARPGVGIGKLIDAGCAAKVLVSHIGTNPETQRLMLAGELAVELVPQGTLAERIRAGGAGLGGVLTATGLGTLAAEGRQVIQVDGRDWLVEPALRAEIALVAARSAGAELQPADGHGRGHRSGRAERDRAARRAAAGRDPHTRRAHRPPDRATATRVRRSGWTWIPGS